MISANSLLTMVRVSLSQSTGTRRAAGVAGLGLRIDLMQIFVAVEPVAGGAGGSSNVQPCSAMCQCTTETPIAFSRPLSLRMIRVRCAQGQASET